LSYAGSCAAMLPDADRCSRTRWRGRELMSAGSPLEAPHVESEQPGRVPHADLGGVDGRGDRGIGEVDVAGAQHLGDQAILRVPA